jgi:predicted nuclease with TOPRIM domain
MDNMFLIIFIIVMISLVGVVFLLSQEHKKLRRDYNVLKDHLERNNKDIAGLCSAAVSVDTRLSNNNEQLKGIVEKVTDFDEQKQQTAQPYHSAIQKVREGANAEELIQQCGLTQEEAILLIRLHGNS